MWAAWQVKYRIAHIKRKPLIKANPQSCGTANCVVGENNTIITGYLDNIIANAATNNSAVMAQLLAKLDKLTTEVNTMQQ
jgi:hypothetical protein